ncbi:MAG TPA: hypothetical protein PLZ15_00510 [Melioribacteraceae bacterium]|nr:hypothetical protein [Melioribacteraceae bacterium]
METKNQKNANPYVEQVNQLKNDFTADLGKISIHADLKPEVAERKKREENGMVIDKFKTKLEILMDNFERQRKGLVTKANKIKFPLFYSIVSTEKLIGSNEIQSAINLLSSSRPEALIISELKSAVDEDRMDYFSQLVKMLSQITGNTEKNAILKSEILSFAKSVYDKLGINEIERQISEIEMGMIAAKSFGKLLGHGTEILEPVKTLDDWKRKFSTIQRNY